MIDLETLTVAQQQEQNPTHGLPKSHIPFATGLSGLAVLIGFFFLTAHSSAATKEFAVSITRTMGLPTTPMITLMIMLMGAMTFVMAVTEKMVRGHLSNSKLQPETPDQNNRLAVKLVGLYGTYAVLGFIYWLFPEYHGDYYQRFWQILWLLVPVCLVIAPLYFWYVDRRMTDPKDGYYHMGALLLSPVSKPLRQEVNWRILAEHGRVWIIKGFFLPLMLMFFANNVGALVDFNPYALWRNHSSLYEYAYLVIFTVDVAYAGIGYILTLKLFDAHVKSADPSLLGWVVCIMCYPPFWSSVFGSNYLGYEEGFYWGAWLGNNQTLYAVWGILIVVSIAIYSMATVSFGLRFSNLTYRGLITTGVYRWTKHPAYVAKNLSWWLISIPFITNADWTIAVRNSLLLLGVNYIYYLRAITEERHLSHYPEYVAYANWMEQHGKLRWLGRILPFLKYNADVTIAKSTRPWWRQI